MAQNIQKDTHNKNDKLSEVDDNVNTSAAEESAYSRDSSYNAKNEIKDCSEDSRQTEEISTKEDSNMVYADNLTEEDLDCNVMDLLQVKCTEDFSDSKQTNNSASFSTRKKVYPIENKCAICNKEFSCQRVLAKHAQEAHPNKRALKCLHCRALFSKFKSVTAHSRRSHLEPNNKSGIMKDDTSVSLGDNEITDDFISNRKGKTYPVENKCAICYRRFSFQKELVKHIQETHPDAKAFKCLYCPTVFSKLKSVTTHYKRSHSKLTKTVICEYCNKAFFTRFLLERHRRSHTEHRPFACNQCEKAYKYKRNLLVHLKTHEKEGESFKFIRKDYSVDDYCHNDDQNPITGDDFCKNDEQDILTGDEYCENDELNYSTEDESCEINEQDFLTENDEDGGNTSKSASAYKAYKHKKNLGSNWKIHYTNNELTETIILDDSSASEKDVNVNNGTYFIIDELNTDTEHFEDFNQEEFGTGNYSDEYDYEDYDYDPANVKISDDLKQNECGVCMKTFNCQQSVAKHMQRCHAEIEFFKCPYCDDNFYSLDTLSVHITIRKHPQKKNVCEMCLKSFERKSDLTRHIRIHTDERPYTCDVCNKKFTQTSQLKRHKEVNHEIAKQALKFNCDVCQRGFLHEVTLKRHLSTHARKIDFACPMCPKTFKTRHDWQRHQETHSSRKYLTCEYCLQSFNDTQILNLHLKGHTGERKYLCTTCGKTYKEKSHLVNHQKAHTTEESERIY